MNINVIVPVVQPHYCDNMLESLEKNTILPTRVILIDNTVNGDYLPVSNIFNIDIYKSLTGKVNESWNLGVCLVDITADYVSILNDDIYLNKWFYQRVLETFDSHRDCGVACPRSVNSMEDMGIGKKERKIKRMERREGCAFTFKKKVLDMIAPIPHHRVKIFHGDDWYHCWTNMNGFSWYKDEGNIIFHHVGASVKMLGYRRVKKTEWNEWQKIRGELRRRSN